MSTERTWGGVSPVFLTAQGTAQGLVTVTSTAGFKVKMEAYIVSPTQPPKALQVKRVLCSTQMELGPTEGNIDARSDLSAYGTDSSVYAYKQKRPAIPHQEIERATYEEEPTVAQRVVLVSPFGKLTDLGSEFASAKAALGDQLSGIGENLYRLSQAMEIQAFNLSDKILVDNDGFPLTSNDGTFIKAG